MILEGQKSKLGPQDKKAVHTKIHIINVEVRVATIEGLSASVAF